ncbi:unnamed protein product [Miscanthus lutarioriparius]|uniref:Retrotransposon gag domain-containing protein n=1 Tax=Miscanthus lutarioriparius TaxID=422564 RepID=A0A811QB78_9POAL|nr:unnamed protein product [Miscanthus lutarioriparius]
MDPQLKLILDEIHQSKVEFGCRSDDHEAQWERRFSDLDKDRIARDQAIDARFDLLEAACGELQQLRVEHDLDERDARITALEAAVTDLGRWRPEMEGVVDNLTLKVQRMSKHYDRVVFDTAPQREPGVFPSPPATSAFATVGSSSTSPSGHCVAVTPQDVGSGVVTTWTHVPASGMSSPSPSHVPLPGIQLPRPPPVPDPKPLIPHRPPLPQFQPIHQPPPISQTHPMPPPTPISHHPTPLHKCCNTPDSTHIAANLGRLPKLPFPKFNVDELMWLSVAEMYLEGPADRWYQSITPQLENATWATFCQLLHDRFDRDQHELLLRQLFNIYQKTTVSAYVTEFSELVDQLKSYSPTNDPMYFTMRFIDGLKPDIKAIVLVQRPKTFDTACSLALLREEVSGPKPARAVDWYSAYQTAPQARVPLLLPPPSPRAEKPGTVPVVPAARAPATVDVKLQALKTYRRALGLCYKCGAKWSRDHRCAPEVLQAVDALWDSVSSDDSLADSSTEDSPAEQLMSALSKSASSGIPASCTVQLIGTIHQVPVQILIDSGSSSSFVNQSLLSQLPDVQLLSAPSSVQVAGGGRLVSQSVLVDVPWTVDGCTFRSNFRTLPLANFDVIIGMDWLEEHSPMQVDWRRKWLAVPHDGQVRILQGLSPALPQHELITKLTVAPTSCPPFSLSKGVLRHKNRIWLGSSHTLQRQVLQEFHSSPVGGHSGALVTYQRIKRLFY